MHLFAAITFPLLLVRNEVYEYCTRCTEDYAEGDLTMKLFDLSFANYV